MIKLVNISKYYHDENSVVMGLRKINVEFNIGEFVAITGESGCGKSTLLNVISGLDSYEDGEMYIDGNETSYYAKEDWEEYRRENIGFIFQNYNLIDSYTVLENVISGMLIQGISYGEAKKRAKQIIARVGLSLHIHQKASKLSGGQKQRLCIARALSKNTKVIVADEPTGNLDSKTGKEIIELLRDISQEKLVLIVTHNYEEVENYVTRKIRLFDGEIVEDRVIKPYEEVTSTKVQPTITSKKALYKNFIFSLLNIKNQPKRSIFLFTVTTIMSLFVLVFYILYGATIDVFSDQKYNDAFYNNYQERVIITKKDREKITKEDVDKLLEIDYVRGYITINELVDSLYLYAYCDNNYFNATVNNVNTLRTSNIIAGTLPTESNEVVVYLPYNEKEAEKFVGKQVTIDVNFVNLDNEYIISGVTDKQFGTGTMVIYLQDADINKIACDTTGLSYIKNDLKIIMNDLETDVLDDLIYNYTIKVDDTLKGNQIIIPLSSSYFSSEIEVYYKDTKLDYTLKDSLNEYISISQELYEDIFTSFSELSLTIASVNKYQYVKEELDNLGYFSTSPYSTSTDYGIIYKLMMLIYLVFVCASNFILIYIVGYLVIKTIMLAKKKDYSILRTIGIGVNDILSITRLEIIISFIVAFIISVLVFYIFRYYTTSAYLVEILYQIGPQHLIIIGLINLLIGFIVSRRFNKMLQKKSIISGMKVE